MDDLYKPSNKIVENAYIDQVKYKEMYNESISDPIKFWGEHGKTDQGGMFSYNDYIEFNFRDRVEHDGRGYDWHNIVEISEKRFSLTLLFNFPSELIPIKLEFSSWTDKEILIPPFLPYFRLNQFDFDVNPRVNRIWGSWSIPTGTTIGLRPPYSSKAPELIKTPGPQEILGSS